MNPTIRLKPNWGVQNVGASSLSGLASLVGKTVDPEPKHSLQKRFWARRTWATAT